MAAQPPDVLCVIAVILFKTGIFYLDGKKITSFQENPQSNPLYCNEQLQEKLKDSSDAQIKPFIWRDEFSVYFAGIKAEQGYYLIGPMFQVNCTPDCRTCISDFSPSAQLSVLLHSASGI